MNIEWDKVAEPQANGYDVDVALKYAPPYPAHDPAWTPRMGQVEIRPVVRPPGGTLIEAPLDHPNIAAAYAKLSLWPAVRHSFNRLVIRYYPLDQPGQHGRGSVCGSQDEYVGEIYATVYSVPGLAEAFVHEMGHTKLRCLGIWLERADRLIANGPEELYESPIRKDKLRPMSAVFHAAYSFTYVTELGTRMYLAERDDVERAGHLQAIQTNYHRLDEGRKVLLAYLKPDDDGLSFFYGYFQWLEKVLAVCAGILRDNGLEG